MSTRSRRSTKSTYARRADQQPEVELPAQGARGGRKRRRQSPNQVVQGGGDRPPVDVVQPAHPQPSSSAAGISGAEAQICNTVTPGPLVVDTLHVKNNAENECIPNTENIQITQVPSVHAKLGLNVTPAIKNKIINGEYVDLANLIDASHATLKDEKTIVMIDGVLTTKEKPKQNINTIEKWTDAFIVFMSIYLAVHPEKTQGLLKYMQSMRLGASRIHGLGWKDYDQQFRLRLSYDPTKSWDTVDNELWLMYMVSDGGNSSGSNLTTPAPGQANVAYKSNSYNKCYNYNYKGLCDRSPCTYKHVCFKCSQNHPVFMCTLNQNQPAFPPFRPRGPSANFPQGAPRMPRYNNQWQPRLQTPRPTGFRKYPN